jgi:hypothetical protein
MVARFNLNTFAVAVHYLDPETYNPEMFERLIQNIKRYTNETSDQGNRLKIAVGICHYHIFEPAPTISEITSAAHQACMNME